MKLSFLYLLFVLSLTACIQDDFIDDFVEESLRITNPIDTIEINTSYQFEVSYFNNIGQEETVNYSWSSEDESIISITPEGLATANQTGTSNLIVEFQSDNNLLRESITVHVGSSTSTLSESISGTINTTTFYTLEGDFELIQENEDLILDIKNNWEASSTLPGLYVYLSNNKNSVANGLEIGPVTVFSGAHSYQIPDAGLMDYNYIVYFCKPFNVKVGDGQIQ